MLRIEERATGFFNYGAQLRTPVASEVKGAILTWVEAQGKKIGYLGGIIAITPSDFFDWA